MDRRAWWATVNRVTKSRTQLSDLTRTHGIIMSSLNHKTASLTQRNKETYS